MPKHPKHKPLTGTGEMWDSGSAGYRKYNFALRYEGEELRYRRGLGRWDGILLARIDVLDVIKTENQPRTGRRPGATARRGIRLVSGADIYVLRPDKEFETWLYWLSVSLSIHSRAKLPYGQLESSKSNRGRKVRGRRSRAKFEDAHQLFLSAVSSAEEGSELPLTGFRDDGSGIFEAEANTLFTRFGRVLGAGAGGTVRKVKRLAPFGGHGPAAVKREDRIEKPEEAKNLINEARILAALGHYPNIVRLIDAFATQREVFMFMERAQTDLQSWSSRKRDRPERGIEKIRRPPREILKIGRGILAGLAYAHKRGVYHMDMKPKNVLIGTDGEAKIADFGFGRLKGVTPRNELLDCYMEIGSRGYIAPECLFVQGGEHGIDFFDDTVHLEKYDSYATGLTILKYLVGNHFDWQWSVEFAIPKTKWENHDQYYRHWCREEINYWKEKIEDSDNTGRLEQDGLINLAQIALDMINENHQERLTVRQVYDRLSGRSRPVRQPAAGRPLSISNRDQAETSPYQVAWRTNRINQRIHSIELPGNYVVPKSGGRKPVFLVLAADTLDEPTDILITTIQDTPIPGFRQGRARLYNRDLQLDNCYLLHLPCNRIRGVKLEFETRAGRHAAPKPKGLILNPGRRQHIIEPRDPGVLADIILAFDSAGLNVEGVMEGTKAGLSTYKRGGFKARLSERHMPKHLLQRGFRFMPVSLITSMSAGARTRYLVTKHYAEGGMGKFNKALSLDSNKLRGMKIVPGYNKRDPSKDQVLAAKRPRKVRKEIQFQNQYSKVKIHDYFEISNKPSRGPDAQEFKKFYIVMDLYACALKHIIKILMQSPPAELSMPQLSSLKYYIYLEVLRDVSRLHADGWCHGDIKDDNILVSYGGKVALADYGSISKKRCYGTVGWYGLTANYACPEGDVGAMGLLYLKIFYGLDPSKNHGLRRRLELGRVRINTANQGLPQKYAQHHDRILGFVLNNMFPEEPIGGSVSETEKRDRFQRVAQLIPQVEFILGMDTGFQPKQVLGNLVRSEIGSKEELRNALRQAYDSKSFFEG